MNATLKSERQDLIANEVLQRGTVTVGDLARFLGVSEITVRRDLEELGKMGVVDRVRGGARHPSPKGPEPPVVQRQMVNVAEKQAIGQVAATLISSGDVIAILSGSTPQELARCIARRTWDNLLVITNGFLIAQEIMRTPGVQIVLIGGALNPSEMGTFGVLAVDMVKDMRLHKLFTGCRGIDPMIGTSNDLPAESEIAIVRALASTSNQVIVMADRTKLGDNFMLPTLPITDIDVLITDSGAAPAMLERFRKQDVQVIVAPVSQPTHSDSDQ
jgi:DeoR/GlpR family transcriptional regulator of sugar metabolism